MGDHPDELHCFACGHPLPYRAAIQCAECAHAWRWGWILSLHDAWVVWKIGRRNNLDLLMGSRIRLRDRIRIRRPSKVWVCPCCAHDL